MLHLGGAAECPTTTAPGNADADDRLARHALFAVVVASNAAKPIEKGPEALTQIAEVYRRGEHHCVGGTDHLHQTGEVILDDAGSFGPAQTPTVSLTLTTPLDVFFGQKKGLNPSTPTCNTCGKRLRRPRSLALRISIAGEDQDVHIRVSKQIRPYLV